MLSSSHNSVAQQLPVSRIHSFSIAVYVEQLCLSRSAARSRRYGLARFSHYRWASLAIVAQMFGITEISKNACAPSMLPKNPRVAQTPSKTNSLVFRDRQREAASTGWPASRFIDGQAWPSLPKRSVPLKFRKMTAFRQCRPKIP